MHEAAESQKLHKGLVDTQCESEFFTMRFFKKGSLHLTFKNEKLWETFNRVVAAERGWLPGARKGEGKAQYPGGSAGREAAWGVSPGAGLVLFE